MECSSAQVGAGGHDLTVPYTLMIGCCMIAMIFSVSFYMSMAALGTGVSDMGKGFSDMGKGVSDMGNNLGQGVKERLTRLGTGVACLGFLGSNSPPKG